MALSLNLYNRFIRKEQIESKHLYWRWKIFIIINEINEPPNKLLL